MSSNYFDSGKSVDVVLMGRIAIDFNPIDYFKPLSESTTFKKYVGGSPANIAVGLARLGKKVGFLGRVSDDAFGEYVTNYFSKENIDTSHIIKAKKGEKLGLTFTEILSPTSSNILMYREGVADLSLHAEDIKEEYIAKAKFLLISGTALSKSPSREACLKALHFARANNTRVVFDIDYRPYTWKDEDEISVYYQLVGEKSDIIIGSRREYDLMERLCSLEKNDRDSKKYWLNKGAQIVIIKHGEEGSYAYTKESDYKVNIFPVDTVKGFGGGDGYASAFLYGLLSNYSLAKALKTGSASASILVSSHSCSQDMPNEDDLKGFIEKNKAILKDIVIKYEKEI